MQACSQSCTEKGLVLYGGMKCLHTEAVQQLRNHIFFSAIVFSHQQKLSWQLHCTAIVLCFHTQYNTGILLIPARTCSYGVPCVSKLYIDSECIILIAGIYKCPGTFINHHQHHSVNVYMSSALQSICCILN